MYTCGPTVYAAPHIGNYRAFLTYDLLKRVVKILLPDVVIEHVCNLTDIDDKIINACKLKGLTVKELTSPLISAFFRDLSSLNITPATSYPKATEHIPEMISMVEDLVGKGLAYKSEEDQSWYYNVSMKEGYGKQLTNLDPENLVSQERASSSPSPSSSRDFVLWKSYKPSSDIPSSTFASTVLGPGRPGWHLECSAISQCLLGSHIDLHMGGEDLKFPHHENEIAQSEGCLNDGSEWCTCFVHNSFILTPSSTSSVGEKMSKSAPGKAQILSDVCPTNDLRRAYRYLIISSHYRNPLTFTNEALKGAKAAVKRVDKLLVALSSAPNPISKASASSSTTPFQSLILLERFKFLQAISDDLSTPKASACLFAIVKACEKELRRSDNQNPDLDLVGLRMGKEVIEFMDEVFGVFGDGFEDSNKKSDSDSDEALPIEIVEIANKRMEAKRQEEWAKADELRAILEEKGYNVKDRGKEGAKVTKRLDMII